MSNFTLITFCKETALDYIYFANKVALISFINYELGNTLLNKFKTFIITV